jgi:DNA/RNA endonuclease YhcR with UshA esterase domain
VAFEGVATVSLNIFSTSTTGNQFNVQDATGGVLILDVPLSTGIVQGDSVRVIGATQISSGEYVIRSPTITRLGTGTVPVPRTVTAAQVAASTATDPLQGILVRVGGVQVTAVSGTATSTAYNVTVTDGAGSTFIVRVGSANTGIPQTYWQIGRSYDVTGLLGNFNGAQVKVRSPADVQLRSSAQSIAAVRAAAFADSAGTRFDTVTVEGVVHAPTGPFGATAAYIQDATAGILLFNLPVGTTLAVGDSIRVTAAIDWFGTELELVRFSSTSPMIVERLGTGAAPQPRTISGTQFNSRAFEGQFVRIANATADSIGTVSGSGAYTVWLRTSDNVRVQVRIQNTAIGIPASTWVIGNRYNVIGALSVFGGVPQLKPRSAADVTAGTAGVLSIAAAKQETAGDTVVVEGVVTAPIGIFGAASGTSTNAYISDGTAGIQIFGVPSNVTLDVGDIVRVRGVLGAFSGEQQIARFSSTELLQITELGTGAAPAPVRVTGAQVAARTFEGQLVRLDSVVVLSVGTVSGSGGYNVTVRAADGTEVVVRNDRAAVGVPVATWSVGAVYDVIGVLSAFNSAPQLKVRGPSDVIAR